MSNKAYRQRNIILKRMGYIDYQEYLSSPLWKSIRTKVLELWPKCDVCGEQARVVHHRFYREHTLRGISLRFLHPLCFKCHEFVEIGCAGKRTAKQARARLRGLFRLNGTNVRRWDSERRLYRIENPFLGGQ